MLGSNTIAMVHVLRRIASVASSSAISSAFCNLPVDFLHHVLQAATKNIRQSGIKIYYIVIHTHVHMYIGV